MLPRLLLCAAFTLLLVDSALAAGDDTLTGGAGFDALRGGDGADTADYADAAAHAVTLGGDADDRVGRTSRRCSAAR